MADRVIDGLPPGFHQTFAPERRQLSSLLDLAEKEFEGTVDAISEASGIPTGKSSGKVVPHIKYAKGMGLIEDSDSKKGIYRLVLTPLGRQIRKEDGAIHEYLTQLILHLMLARPIGGASVWHIFFGASGVSLGRQFTAKAAATFISSKLGKNSSIPGPLFSTYREESSLARTAMLIFDQDVIMRTLLPNNPDNYWGIAYCWLNYWERSAPDDQQLALSSLEAVTGFQEVAGWSNSQYEGFLSWAADNVVVRIDRQTGEPLILRTESSRDLIERIYSELI